MQKTKCILCFHLCRQTGEPLTREAVGRRQGNGAMQHSKFAEMINFERVKFDNFPR